jgi:hypothetical protein
MNVFINVELKEVWANIIYSSYDVINTQHHCNTIREKLPGLLNNHQAPPAGFEPTTLGLEDLCSVH